MKNIVISLVLVGFLYFSFPAQEATALQFDDPAMVLTVETEGMENSYIFLSRRSSGSWVNIDSTRLDSENSSSLKAQLTAPEVLYLRLENSGKPIPFFAENSTIHIYPDFDSPDQTKVSGSAVHSEYETYQLMFTELNEKRNSLMNEYNEARKNNDQTKLESIIAEFDKASQEEMAMNKRFVSQNASSWVSPYIIRSKMFYSLSLEELKSTLGQLSEKVSSSIYVDQLNEQISTLEKVAIGQTFTDFELPTPDGGSMALSEITGENYILVDFWASWCGPCRRENPHVVALYEKFHDKGFDIIGVSLDNSKENWLKAIEDDKLDWHHVSDLKGWGSAAGKLYGVSSIPHTVLLDPRGVIIEKNLRGDALEAKIAELLED